MPTASSWDHYIFFSGVQVPHNRNYNTLIVTRDTWLDRSLHLIFLLESFSHSFFGQNHNQAKFHKRTL